MDLKKYKFEKTDDIDLAFSTKETDKTLLAEAIERGFYNGRTKYNDMFSELFFSGGNVEFKKGLDDEFRKTAWLYMRALMGSFAPKHEEKEAVCAMILSEITK